MLYRDEEAEFSREYLIHIVDRVGGGDSFGGGLIHALMSGCTQKEAIEFAAAASCLKHTIEHDFNLVTEAEVMALAAGITSCRLANTRILWNTMFRQLRHWFDLIIILI